MTFSKIIRQKCADLIAQRIHTGTAAPTDAEIAARFNLDTLQQARGLLADCADEGRITICGYGSSRYFKMGRVKPASVAAPRPLRSVRKPDRTADQQVDHGVAKILAIAARTAAKPRTAAPPPQPPPPAAPPAPALVMRRLPTAPGRAIAEPTPAPWPRDRRQLNIHFEHADFERLAAAAAAADLTAATFARAAIIAATAGKPTLPAAVASAAIRAGVPVLTFMAVVLARGLAAVTAEAPRRP